jgi:hypothetical protein
VRHAWYHRQGGTRVGAQRVHLQVDRLGPAQAGCQVVGRVHGHDAPLVDDHDAVAGLADLREDVRAQDDRVVAGERGDELSRLDDLLRVEARRRLVEDEHLGIVQQRLRQTDPLPVALRELAAVASGHVGDPRALHDRPDARDAITARDALDARAERQVVGDGHLRVQRRRLRQVSGAALGLDGLLEHVVAGHDALALGGRHVAGQHAHRGGLAGAVRPQKPEDLAARGREAHVVHGRHRPVAFREVLDFDHLRFLQSARPTFVTSRARTS